MANVSNEIFNHGDRPGFLERMGRLGGQTTFREPGGAGGSPYSSRMMTTENGLILALMMGRRRMPKEIAGKIVYVPDPRDIGPEMAYTIATAVPDQRERVVTWLASKLLSDTGPKGKKAANYRNILAQHCYEMVAFGKQQSRLPSRLPMSWEELRNIGIGWLWMAAESTIERAERAHRKEARAA